MKITKSKLARIIKEETQKLLLEYEQYIYRDANGDLWISDDDGNRDRADHLEGQYGHLEPGGEGVTILGTGGGYGGGGYGDRSRRSYRRRRW